MNGPWYLSSFEVFTWLTMRAESLYIDASRSSSGWKPSGNCFDKSWLISIPSFRPRTSLPSTPFFRTKQQNSMKINKSHFHVNTFLFTQLIAITRSTKYCYQSFFPRFLVSVYLKNIINFVCLGLRIHYNVSIIYYIPTVRCNNSYRWQFLQASGDEA